MKRPLKWRLVEYFLGALALAVVGPIMVAAHVGLQTWFFNTTRDLHAWAQRGPLQHVVGTAACVGFAAVALFFRWNQRTFYGVVEVGTAIAVIWLVLGADLAPASTFGAIVGSIYVMVRGVDNFREGWSERQRADEARRADKKAKAAVPAAGA